MPNIKKDDFLWKIDRHNGGIAEDSRIDRKGSYRLLLGADVRRDSGLIYLAKKTAQHDDGNDIDQLIKWIDFNPANNDVYYYGGTKIYKEASGTYSVARTLSSGTPDGEGLAHFNGKLYYRWDDKLGHFDYSLTWTDSWQTGLEVVSFSPMCRFKNYLLVGHGRYVGTVDDLGTWDADRLKLPPNYVVRSIFTVGSFAAILATYGSSISGSEDGMCFLWGGTKETYDDYFPIDGNPHAGIAKKNKLIIIAGTQPSIIESLGGVGEVVSTIPRVNAGETAEVYPGAIELYDKMVHFGISDGTATDVLRVVYNWGAKNSRFGDILNPEYPTSFAAIQTNLNNVKGTQLQITAVRKIGTTLRFAWKNGSTYGIDYIDNTKYQPTAIARTLAFDRESPYLKNASKLFVDFGNKLAANESVVAKISGDPYGDPDFSNSSTTELYPVLSKTQDTDNARTLEYPLTEEPGKILSRDLHIELQLRGNGDTSPTIKRVWTKFEELDDTL